MDEIDSITEDDLIAALLLSAQEGTATVRGAMTTRDLAQEVGCTLRWVRRQLRLLIDEDRVEPVKIPSKDISGHISLRPAYRLKVKKEAENVN